MPATKFVVNYSKATGRIRMIVSFPEASENDSDLSSVNVGPGEAQLYLPIAQYADLITLQQTLNGITGLTPNDKHDCFDASGKYVCSANCDPLCGDKPPPGCATMMPTIGAAVGGVFANAIYTAPLPPPLHIDAVAVP